MTDSPRLAGENLEHIDSLAATQSPLPPIVVHRPTMRVIDGFHRLRVAIQRGEGKVEARLFDGDEAEAFVLAVQLNIAHGLPLSTADRKHAARRIITANPQWSDRLVASVTGLSPGTIAEIRKRIAGHSDHDSRRIGRDGRARPVDGGTGRQIASQLLMENPDLSLRQVAQRAAISPETVRDVRNRLRNGENPVPGPPRQRLSVMADRDVRAAVEWLKADPALRYTDTGRALLRLLAVHAAWAEERETALKNIPAHCRETVATVAQQFADFWRDFAARLHDEDA